MVHRVRVALGGAVVAGGGLSTFYFVGASGDEALMVDAVGDFWDAIAPQITSNVTYATEPDVDELDTVTGTLLGSAAVTPRTGAGTSAEEALPWATQGLLRLRTGAVVGGRELRGRLFIPGLTEGKSLGGKPTAAVITAINSAAATFAARGDVAWHVWSRTHGASADVVTATMWDNFAVLRSRRT